MKNAKIEALLKGKSSPDLKELRKQFNAQISSSMFELEKAEQKEMDLFIDGLRLDRDWYGSHTQDVVSIN